MLGYREKSNGVKYSEIEDYNYRHISFKFLENEFKDWCIKNNPYQKKTELKKNIETLNIMFTFIVMNSSLVNKIEKDDKNGDNFSKYISVPASHNFYHRNTLLKEFPAFDYLSNVISNKCLTYPRINKILNFLTEKNIIEVKQGKQREFKRTKLEDNIDLNTRVIRRGSKDGSLLEKTENGLWRKVKLKYTDNWLIDNNNMLFILEAIDELKKYKKDNKQDIKYINRYRDKSKDKDSNPIDFNKNTLKYKKVKSYYETTKYDKHEKDMRVLNEYLMNISPILSFKRVYGTDSSKYGRFVSLINQLPKQVRSEVNNSLGVTEEIDIKSCALNILSLSLCNNVFKDVNTNDDVYTSLLLNIENLKPLFLKSHTFLDSKKVDIKKKLLEGKLRVYTKRKDENLSGTYYIDVTMLNNYRPVGKKIFMSLFGNNTEVMGKKSLVNNMRKIGLYLSHSDPYISMQDENKDYYKRLETEYYDYPSDTYTLKDLQEKKKRDSYDVERWNNFCIKNNTITKKEVKEHKWIKRCRISYDDIITSTYITFSNEYKELQNLLFTDIYSLTQNIESKILEGCLIEAMNNNDIITHAHDCIFVKPERAEYYRNLQNTLLRDLSIIRKKEFYDLKINNLLLANKIDSLSSIVNEFESVHKQLKSNIDNYFKSGLKGKLFKSKSDLLIYLNDIKKSKPLINIVSDCKSKVENIFTNIQNINHNLNIDIHSIFFNSNLNLHKSNYIYYIEDSINIISNDYIYYTVNNIKSISYIFIDNIINNYIYRYRFNFKVNSILYNIENQIWQISKEKPDKNKVFM